MYWHGPQEDTKRTVNKIIEDRPKGILVLTGIGASPCPLEDLKLTLDSITLNEMQYGPEEQFLYQCPNRDKHGVPRSSWLMIQNFHPLVMKRSSGG